METLSSSLQEADQRSRSHAFWKSHRSWVISLFLIVLALEYATPPDYVFGYLYIGPILIANARLSRKATLFATLIAVILTLINLWIPNSEGIRAATIANRAIAILSLVVTGILSDRNRQQVKAILQQQAQLQAQEKLASIREDFVSTLTHDLKTPLLGAIETLSLLQQEQFGSIQPRQRHVFEVMERSQRTTLQLVETLLDVYRIDAEGLVYQPIPVNLTTLTEDVIASLTTLATSRRIPMALNFGQSDFRRDLWVKGDPLQLKRVLTNLLINSINHSRRDHRIEVVLESQADQQTVKILDSGPGITPEELPFLFERFYQGHSDRQAQGTGLGLYLSRQIIHSHGGRIWAENRDPRGALFGFSVPADS